MSAPPNASDFIGGLCIALAHRWEPERLFMILTAYLDESGTHDGSPVTIMGGILGRADQWARFETQFERIKKKHGFNVLHTKKFRRRAGDFKGWSSDACLNLINDLAPITVDSFADLLVMILDNQTYETEYRQGFKPNKVRLDSKYGLCFRNCVTHCLEQAYKRRLRKKLPHLHIVLESGHANAGDAERIFSEMKKELRGSQHDMLETITFADKQSCNPLMMADFIAHTNYWREVGKRAGTVSRFANQPSRPSPGKTIAILRYSPGGLAEIKADLIKGKATT
jgi:hypothetical protein